MAPLFPAPSPEYLRRARELERYRARFGPGPVPPDYGDGSLHRWIRKTTMIHSRTKHVASEALVALGLPEDGDAALPEVLWVRALERLRTGRFLIDVHTVVLARPLPRPILDWTFAQRRYLREGQLSEERLLRLRRAGLVMGDPGRSFQSTLAMLGLHVSPTGRLELFADRFGARLLRWWRKQLYRFQRGKLPRTHARAVRAFLRRLSPHHARPIRLLQSPPGSPQALQWHSQFRRLMDHWRQHGTVEPGSMSQGSALSTWLRRQKRSARAGLLREAQLQRLRALGVQVDRTGDDRWDAHLRELEEFAAHTGHTRVPRTPALRRLSIWLCEQRTLHRKGKLEPERAAALEAVGVEWSPIFGARTSASVRRRRS